MEGTAEWVGEIEAAVRTDPNIVGTVQQLAPVILDDDALDRKLFPPDKALPVGKWVRVSGRRGPRLVRIGEL
jgi:hypothetical protein